MAVDFPELPDPQSMFCLRFFRHDPRPFFRFAKVSGKNEFSVFLIFKGNISRQFRALPIAQVYRPAGEGGKAEAIVLTKY